MKSLKWDIGALSQKNKYHSLARLGATVAPVERDLWETACLIVAFDLPVEFYYSDMWVWRYEWSGNGVEVTFYRRGSNPYKGSKNKISTNSATRRIFWQLQEDLSSPTVG